MEPLKEKYNKTIIPEMTKIFGYKSVMAVPRISKVVINSGIGKLREKKDAVETVERQLSMIVGQKISPRPAKIAISAYKTREGMIV
jgi:large subunit ribosomal protein L5